MKAEYKAPVLQVRNVCHGYNGIDVLRNFNATVRDVVGHGQVVAIVGRSGVGKTTLFRILAGLEEPDSGVVLLNQEETPVRKGLVGVVSQKNLLFKNRTVLGNLLVAGSQAGLKGKDLKDKAKSFLEKLGLTGYENFWPEKLSGGMKQRVAIAQQLMCSEHFLLMDEPFSGLDIISKAEVCNLIFQAANEHELNTFIITTHEVRMAIAVADHVWMIGRDRDTNGAVIPGAYIKKEYDLIERDLCWQPDVTQTTRFTECVREVEAEFANL